MKYEIEIDDSLVPEGKVPDSLERDRTMMLVLKFKKAPVSNIPGFVPEGWYFSINKYGVALMHKDKPCCVSGLWLDGKCKGHVNVTTEMTKAEIAEIRGDLPPEQCCFQQKGNG